MHKNQQKLLDYLLQHKGEDIRLADLSKELETSSNNLTLHHLKKLEDKGYIKKTNEGYTIHSTPQSSKDFIRYYGKATCSPGGSFLDHPKEYIELSPLMFKITNALKTFIVEAQGDSMEDLISDGDTIIAEEMTNFKNGDIVVCDENGEARIKEFKKENKHIFLISKNQNYPIIVVDETRPFKVIGKVIQIIKNKIK